MDATIEVIRDVAGNKILRLRFGKESQDAEATAKGLVQLQDIARIEHLNLTIPIAVLWTAQAKKVA